MSFRCSRTVIPGESGSKLPSARANSNGIAFSSLQPPKSLILIICYRKPEWTAFITHQVTSRRWMRKVGSKTIYLADLQPFVFSDDYTPQVESGGEHELYFLQSRGKKLGLCIGSIPGRGWSEGERFDRWLTTDPRRRGRLYGCN